MPAGDKTLSLSLHRLLTDVKTKWLFLFTTALLVVVLIGYPIFSRPNKELLIKDLNVRLKEEKFEQLYEEADAHVRLNVTKERFVKRMKSISAKLKTIDENLAFKRDAAATEQMLGPERDHGSSFLNAFQRLEKDGKSVFVIYLWSTEGQFMDLSVLPAKGTSQEYQVLGVSGRSYYVGNQVLDW